MKNIAIVLAGGVGARVGSDLPKQFIEVMGKPIMIYTLEAFENNDFIDEIILVCVERYIDLAKKYCDEYSIKKLSRIVCGGKDFLHSCINGVNALRSTCSKDDIVIITSADRPFISSCEIEDSINICKIHGSGVAARACSLCMFKISDKANHSSEYLRNSLVQTATPWAFNYYKLLSALDMYEDGKLKLCEDYPVAIYAAAGNEVYFSAANAQNIKITEKLDIILMETILKERGLCNEQGDF